MVAMVEVQIVYDVSPCGKRVFEAIKEGFTGVQVATFGAHSIAKFPS